MKNIIHWQILEQPNGKFALWDSKGRRFRDINYPSAEALKQRILDKVEIILDDSLHLNEMDGYFEMIVEEFKYAHGIIPPITPKEEAMATLDKMGLSCDGDQE